MAARMPEILVVDDDEGVRDTISEMLLDRGFRVRTAATGLEALAIIEERPFDMMPFDMMIADMRLPGGLSGLETTQCARVRHPALKCLFISGYSEPAVCDPELDDFVAKPFRPTELLGCVWKVLGGNLDPRFAVPR